MATHYFTLSSKTAQIKKTVNSLLHTYDSWADDLARDDLVRSDPAKPSFAINHECLSALSNKY